jgi:hypothetical protein
VFVSVTLTDEQDSPRWILVFFGVFAIFLAAAYAPGSAVAVIETGATTTSPGPAES